MSRGAGHGRGPVSEIMGEAYVPAARKWPPAACAGERCGKDASQ
jgi:hypothetical protein